MMFRVSGLLIMPLMSAALIMGLPIMGLVIMVGRRPVAAERSTGW